MVDSSSELLADAALPSQLRAVPGIDKKPAEVADARVSADASIGANWMINANMLND